MDWNHDGKHDLQDDFITQKLISSDEKKTTPSNKPHGSGCSSSILSTILPLLYLSFFLPGNISINGFTGFIALICIGILGWKLLYWLFTRRRIVHSLISLIPEFLSAPNSNQTGQNPVDIVDYPTSERHKTTGKSPIYKRLLPYGVSSLAGGY